MACSFLDCYKALYQIITYTGQSIKKFYASRHCYHYIRVLEIHHFLSRILLDPMDLQVLHTLLLVVGIGANPFPNPNYSVIYKRVYWC